MSQLNQIAGQALAVLRLVCGVLLLLAIAIAALRLFAPIAPTLRLEPQSLAWLAGAYWLARG